MRKSIAFVDQLRKAVEDSGIGYNALGRMIELDKAVVSRFMAGKSFLSEASLNRLAKVLRLTIHKGKR